MISTFDPQSGSNGRWVYHSLSTSRDATHYKSFLYRGSDVDDSAVDMSFEVDKLLQLFHSQKRPAEPNSLPGGSPQKRQRILAEPDIPMNPIIPRITGMSTITPPTLVPPTLVGILPSSELGLTSEKNTNSDNASSCDAGDTATVEDEGVLASLPSSKHSDWPLKYVLPMSEGFGKMATMSTGTLADRFSSAFNLPWKKVTWNTHSNIWNSAPKELKRQYIDARFADDGLWKDFAQEVRKLYPDGKVPGKREKK